MANENSIIVGSLLFRKLREALCRYASKITVDAILGAACQRANVSPALMDHDSLVTVITQLKPGIKVFCTPEKVPELMRELEALAR